MNWKCAIAVLLLGSLLTACKEQKSSAEKFAEDGILLIGNNSEPQSQDPHKATAVADGKIICTLLEGDKAETVTAALPERKRIPAAAPALAPEDTPIISGDAKGFRKTV